MDIETEGTTLHTIEEFNKKIQVKKILTVRLKSFVKNWLNLYLLLEKKK